MQAVYGTACIDIAWRLPEIISAVLYMALDMRTHCTALEHLCVTSLCRQHLHAHCGQCRSTPSADVIASAQWQQDYDYSA
jgi:hypothetical protein